MIANAWGKYTLPHSPKIPPNEKGPEGYTALGAFNMAER